MTKEQEEIIIEELEQLIEKTSFLREEEFYTLFTIHEVQNIASLLNMLKEKDAEIEKKDKIIDLYIDELVTNMFDRCCQECCRECEKDKDTLRNCIKQYFERIEKNERI